MDTFLHPAWKYRGTDLWMLNDRLEAAELDRQLREMKDKGIHSILARTFIGLKSDYPGAGYKSSVAAIVAGCKKYGMKVFLQACYMPGGIPDLPDEHAHLTVQPIARGDKADPAQIVQSDGGVDYALVRHPCFLDMLSGDAVRYYIKTSYEDMWDGFRDEFGKTVLSVWVDEPHFSGVGLPWTPALPGEFQRMWGYSLKEHVCSLFTREGDCAAVRYHFWRTVLQLLQDAYFEEVSRWCHENRLLFSGHLMYEDTLAAQIAYTCECMPLYKYFDIPGIDFLTAELGDIGYRFVNTPVQCASAAHQAGRDTVLCEMFGVSTENLTFAEQKYLFDHFAALGVNHKMLHGVFYSLRGRGKRAYPPHIGYQQPYWNAYGAITDYFARASWFVSRGNPAADILVIHPAESAFAEYEPEPAGGNRERDGKFNELLQKLLGMQALFELGDEDTIGTMGSVASDGRLVIGRMAYRAVILPGLSVIRRSTLSLLEAFARSGGRVILLGCLPARLDGRPDGALPRRLAGLPNACRIGDAACLKPLLCAEGNRPFGFGCAGDPSQVIINCRQDGRSWYYFVFNGDHERARDAWLSMPGGFIAEQWNGADGSVSPVKTTWEGGQTKAAFTLEAGGSVMLAFKESRSLPLPAGLPETPVLARRYKGGWRVRRRNPNSLLLEYACFRKGEGGFSPLYPILAIQHMLCDEDYAGPVTLRFPFIVDAVPHELRLAAENPGSLAITVNGTPVTGAPDGYYADKSFETLPVPQCLREGENTVEVSLNFSPVRKPALNYTSLFQDLGGTELEPMYLVGGFGVAGQAEPSYRNCIRLNRFFRVIAEPEICDGELVTAGYPFYCGTMDLTRTIHLNGLPEGASVLKLESFHGCLADIWVNGRKAGMVAWPPYETDISGLLKEGENTVTVSITNTLRNLLGPFHRPAGDLKDTWGDYSSPDDPWMGSCSKSDNTFREDWYDHREPDTEAWTEGYMQVPFGLGGISVEYRIVP